MSSIGGILNTARSAIFAHQTAVQIHSHNVANAGTEGYSRQRADLVQLQPQQFSYGNMGTGVTVSDISRARDSLADVGVRRESGKAASHETRRDVLSEVETIFGEPSEIGLASTLDRFWNAWSDLANQPTSNAARSMVRQRGEQLAGSISSAATRLGEVRADTRSRISAALAEVNSTTRQIADLNVQVVGSEGGGKTASDLRDMRDRLVDSLARLGSVRVVERGDGSIAVSLDGATVVDGSDATELGTEIRGRRINFTVGSSPLVSPSEGSRLGQLVRLHNDDIPAVSAQLDELATGLVAEVNALHAAGETTAGETGINFFEPISGAGAASRMSLSGRVAADAAVVVVRAAGRGATDTSVALGIAALRDLKGTLTVGGEDASFGGYYQEMIAGVAQEVSAAENSYTVYESLTAQAMNRRDSVSGVSVDEELIKLMQSQQAYVAATRLVNTVDEMTQALINMV